MSDVEDIGYGRQFADFYDRIFPPGTDADQTAAWLAALHPGDGTPSLELGVGTGRVALPLAERTGDVVGVDSSPEMLEVLRGALAQMPRPVTPVRADIRDYEDGRRYGLVYCVCGTLSMLLDAADQQQVLETCARTLAPEGTVVIETHNPAAVDVMHQGRLHGSFFVSYPGQDAGLLSYSTIDPPSRLWRLSHTWIEGDRSRVASETSRLTTPEEIDAYADHAGLRLQARYGDWSGSAFTGIEPNVVCVYRGLG
ncbi:MAG: class I SAM-dependent methyltransferase [Egibacteraceae bacterium]